MSHWPADLVAEELSREVAKSSRSYKATASL